jgi:hypothetical protein
MSHIDRRAMSLLGLAAIVSSPRAMAQDAYPNREIWEQVQLALVLVWSPVVPLEQAMLVPLVAHCK